MVEQFITASRAKELIAAYTPPLAPKLLKLSEAAGLALAQDVWAPCNIPAYPQSSMDGYALHTSGIGQPLQIVGVMPAGSMEAFALQPHQAVRIFTGAAVPKGANAVLVQEKARVELGLLYVDHPELKAGDNIRPVGSEIEEGQLALKAGHRLTPAAMGFLAGAGIEEVLVHPPLAATIIVTGNELQPPGQPLGYGKVYESNSYTLKAALQPLPLYPVSLHYAPDDLARLSQLLKLALAESQLILLTGGVSVGDYDFTLQALEACGVMPVFHKIKQRPGKPILFGVKDDTLVFGLPGNPASVLTCFYMYVLPAICARLQIPSPLLQLYLPAANAIKKALGLTHFLKARVQDGKVHLLTGQESYKLHSFALANALAVIPETTTEVAEGDTVAVYILP